MTSRTAQATRSANFEPLRSLFGRGIRLIGKRVRVSGRLRVMLELSRLIALLGYWERDVIDSVRRGLS